MGSTTSRKLTPSQVRHVDEAVDALGEAVQHDLRRAPKRWPDYFFRPPTETQQAESARRFPDN